MWDRSQLNDVYTREKDSVRKQKSKSEGRTEMEWGVGCKHLQVWLVRIHWGPFRGQSAMVPKLHLGEKDGYTLSGV